MNKMNILIGGDSWSLGEWDGDWKATPSTYGVSHLGTTRYLRDAGHSVINVGAGSIGNIQALNNVKRQIQRQTSVSYFDYLIFFFTDPLRDCSAQEINSGKLFELIESKTRLFIDQLKQVKSTHPDLKIILLGGYAKIETVDDSIDHVIPSIIEMLVPGVQDTSCSNSPDWKQHLPDLSLFASLKQKQEIVDFCDRADRKLEIMGSNPDLFYPDGGHPNRHAHRLITDKILTLLTV